MRKALRATGTFAVCLIFPAIPWIAWIFEPSPEPPPVQAPTDLTLLE